MTTYIIIKQTVGKVDDTDATMAELEQLSDDVIDVVCLAKFLRPAFRLLAVLSGYFRPHWQMAGMFRLIEIDEDERGADTGEPDRFIDELGLDK